MGNAFQCVVCGVNIQIGLGIDQAICPFCGTSWKPTEVRLANGTTYDIQENGRWVLRETEPEPSPWVPTPLIFGEL